jgi:hypothetical protein
MPKAPLIRLELMILDHSIHPYLSNCYGMQLRKTKPGLLSNWSDRPAIAGFPW